MLKLPIFDHLTPKLNEASSYRSSMQLSKIKLMNSNIQANHKLEAFSSKVHCADKNSSANEI